MLGVADTAVPEPVALAQICSRVENDWVGAQTGLLDQLASLCGETDRALRIDFRSLEVGPVSLELGGYTLVTLDSGERHANAGLSGGAQEGYNQRRAECARACELLEIESLRDADLARAASLPAPLAARVRHVVTENERVEQTVAALASGDLAPRRRAAQCSHTPACATTSRSPRRPSRRRWRDCAAPGPWARGSSEVVLAAMSWVCSHRASARPQGAVAVHPDRALICSLTPPGIAQRRVQGAKPLAGLGVGRHPLGAGSITAVG